MTENPGIKIKVFRAVSVFVATVLTLGLPVSPSQAQNAQQSVTIKEYSGPDLVAPNGITRGPDGALWVADSSSKGGFSDIYRVTTTGVFTKYHLNNCCAPEIITTGPDGALWFTKSYSNQIGRITTDGQITEYSVPSASSYPLGITSAPDGALWFTEVHGNRIGRVTTSGAITEYPMPQANSNPYEITLGPDGALWFTESNVGRIGRISTAGVITEYPLRRTDSSPTAITSGPDGRLWFVEYSQYTLAAITVDGVITEYPLKLSSGIWPNVVGLAAGPDGAVWFTEVGPNKLGRITPAGSVTEFMVPTPNSFPLRMATGPDGAIWFTEGAAGKIGQAVLSKAATSTFLVSSLNPSIYGQPVTWLAKVTSLRAVTPTGNVAFRWSRDSQNYTIGTAALDATGVATLTRWNLNTDPFGAPYPLVAVYLGDAKNLSSTSAVLPQHVLQAKTAARISSSANPSRAGQAVTFTATITSPTVTPTGPVTFTAGKQVLGTAQIVPWSHKATLTISTLPVGSTTIGVTYLGNSNVARSSAVLTQTVR